MKPANCPDISVIIPVYNGESTLPTCLDAVFRTKDITMEVIVVDDGSTDSSMEIASEYPVKLITLSKNIGGGAARNPGADIARAPVLFHTDADVELLPGTLKLILDKFYANPELDAVFGAYSQQCPHNNFFSEYKNLHHHFIHQISSKRAATFWSGCGAVRKSAFKAVGGYQHLEFLYDIDLGYRLNKAGYHVELAPTIQVRHHKYYSFLSLVKSDLIGRAVPWTRIMWKHGIFKNDMNTRGSDTVSVALLLAALLVLILPISIIAKASAFFSALAIVSCLNRDWWRTCCRYGGHDFAGRAMAMKWLYFLICGVGALGGTFLFAKEAIERRLS